MVKFLRPSLEIDNIGGWSPSAGGNGFLWDRLNEEVPDGLATFVQSPALPDTFQTFEVKVFPELDPLINLGHKIRFSAEYIGLPSVYHLKVQLLEGLNLIAETPEVLLTTDFVTTQYDLTQAEAKSITDYTDLRLKFIPRFTSGFNSFVNITWAEMEVPDRFFQSATITDLHVRTFIDRLDSIRENLHLRPLTDREKEDIIAGIKTTTPGVYNPIYNKPKGIKRNRYVPKSPIPLTYTEEEFAFEFLDKLGIDIPKKYTYTDNLNIDTPVDGTINHDISVNKSISNKSRSTLELSSDMSILYKEDLSLVLSYFTILRDELKVNVILQDGKFNPKKYRAYAPSNIDDIYDIIELEELEDLNDI